MKKIEVIKNTAGRGLLVRFLFNEKIKTICPVSKEFDYGEMEVQYTAGGSLYELVSLRQYIKKYQGKVMFTEEIISDFFCALLEVMKPESLKVIYRSLPELENAHGIYTYDKYELELNYNKNEHNQ